MATSVLLPTNCSTTCWEVIKGELNDSLCLKGWIKKQQQQLLFRLSKMKHSQEAAAAAAVDEDLISLLMNDPLLFCQRLLRQTVWRNAANPIQEVIEPSDM